jgi:pimeloyl-ACP methyl ester carboxylesterase
MGGGVALQISIRHPELVRKLVVASASYNSEGVYPEVWAMISTITPEIFEG